MATYKIIAQSKPWKFKAGQEKAIFYVHPTLIGEHSKKLYDLAQQRHQDGNSNTSVLLGDCDSDTFSRFVEFIYTGDYPAAETQVRVQTIEKDSSIDLWDDGDFGHDDTPATSKADREEAPAHDLTRPSVTAQPAVTAEPVSAWDDFEWDCGLGPVKTPKKSKKKTTKMTWDDGGFGYDETSATFDGHAGEATLLPNIEKSVADPRADPLIDDNSIWAPSNKKKSKMPAELFGSGSYGDGFTQATPAPIQAHGGTPASTSDRPRNTEEPQPNPQSATIEDDPWDLLAARTTKKSKKKVKHSQTKDIVPFVDRDALEEPNVPASIPSAATGPELAAREALSNWEKMSKSAHKKFASSLGVSDQALEGGVIASPSPAGADTVIEQKAEPISESTQVQDDWNFTSTKKSKKSMKHYDWTTHWTAFHAEEKDQQQKTDAIPELSVPTVFEEPVKKEPAFTHKQAWDNFKALSWAQANVQQKSAGYTAKANLNSDEDYSQVFLSHARLHVFACRYDISSLRCLTLSKLHQTLVAFTIFDTCAQDVAGLLEFSYESFADIRSVSELRKLVNEYVACNVQKLMGNGSFKHAMRTCEAASANVLELVVQRLELEV